MAGGQCKSKNASAGAGQSHLPAIVMLAIVRVRVGVCEYRWCCHTIAATRQVCRRECAAQRPSACTTERPLYHASTTLLPCNDARLLVGCVANPSTHPCGSKIPHPNASARAQWPLVPGRWSTWANVLSYKAVSQRPPAPQLFWLLSAFRHAWHWQALGQGWAQEGAQGRQERGQGGQERGQSSRAAHQALACEACSASQHSSRTPWPRPVGPREVGPCMEQGLTHALTQAYKHCSAAMSLPHGCYWLVGATPSSRPGRQSAMLPTPAGAMLLRLRLRVAWRSG